MPTLLEGFPEIAKQLHPIKNNGLLASQIKASSKIEVVWTCSIVTCPEGCLHEWSTTVCNRTYGGHGCPFCCKGGSKKRCCHHTSLAGTHSSISQEWHPSKNGSLKPTEIVACSGKKVWWLCTKRDNRPENCDCLHEWEACVSVRTQPRARIHVHNDRGTSCPFCSEYNRRCCPHTSIAATHSEISDEWHPTKNGDLKPTEVIAGSTTKVWFLCKKKMRLADICNHEWEAQVRHRTQIYNPSGCPSCAHSGYSKAQLYYFAYLSISYPSIQYIGHGGEHHISNSSYKADGFVPETKSIREFHGCFWHGHPTCYNSDDINPCNKQSYKVLYDKTIKKKEFAINQGYQYNEIWECQWNRAIAAVKYIQRLWRKRRSRK